MPRNNYDHLNEDDPLKLEISLPDLVRKVRSMNYGVSRFLTLLVDQTREANKDLTPLTQVIDEALDKGCYY